MSMYLAHFRILDMFGRPNKSNRYLFNGDFVDRGPWSVEVVLTLLSHKLLYSDQFHLNRGNHETEEINKLYGFYNEVMDKYDAQMFALFQAWRQTPPAMEENQPFDMG